MLLTQAAAFLALSLGRVLNLVLAGFLKEDHVGNMLLSEVLQLADELGSLLLFASVLG